MRIEVIIPALNEAESIGDVVRGIPRPPVESVVVVDNGSTDETAERARAAGARVIHEPRRGYGSACLAGIRSLLPETDIVVFLDADGSDDPAALALLVEPIVADTADLVVGSRVLGRSEPGALAWQQRLGNWIATRWLRGRFGLAATDLGPFRAIRRSSLEKLSMSDRGYGWTVQMQLEAVEKGLRYAEVAVPYRRRRYGKSKVTGTMRGSIGAAVKILGLLAWYDLGWARGV